MSAATAAEAAAEAAVRTPRTDTLVLDWALLYAEDGLPVIPLWGVVAGENGRLRCECNRGVACDKPGKHPRIKNWQIQASIDLQLIRRWWARWPNANVGLLMGERSGLLAVDRDGPEGERTLREYEARHGPLLPTIAAVSGSRGGGHLVFVHVPGLKNEVRFAPGLDVRTTGGQIVVAPSQPKPAPAADTFRPTVGARLNGGLHPYVAAALRDEAEELSRKPKNSGRNHQLNVAAFNLGGFVAAGHLERSAVESELMAAAAACGLVAEDGVNQCRATIRSGLEAGMAHPRHPPENGHESESTIERMARRAREARQREEAGHAGGTARAPEHEPGEDSEGEAPSPPDPPTLARRSTSTPGTPT